MVDSPCKLHSEPWVQSQGVPMRTAWPTGAALFFKGFPAQLGFNHLAMHAWQPGCLWAIGTDAAGHQVSYSHPLLVWATRGNMPTGLQHAH